MSKGQNEFLNELERRLAKLPDAQRADVLADYAEHFAIGEAKGKTPAAIAESLGSPRQIAAACMADLAFARVAEPQNAGSRAVSIVRALFAILGLAFFNGLFMLFPALFLASMVAGLWLMAVTPVMVGGAWIVSAVAEYGASLVASFEGLGHLLMSLSFLLLGALLVLAMALVTQVLARAARRYLQLNFQVIRG